MDEKILRISGLDIDWEEIELNTEQAVAEINRIVDQIVVVTLMHSSDVPESVTKTYMDIMVLHQRTYKANFPLAQIMFGTGELLWLASVLNGVVPKMKY